MVPLVRELQGLRVVSQLLVMAAIMASDLLVVTVAAWGVLAQQEQARLLVAAQAAQEELGYQVNLLLMVVAVLPLA
jgi:hypothetical protein